MTRWAKHPMIIMINGENMSKETRNKIKATIENVEKLLISKNIQYGDSALDPIGLFAKGNAEDLIRVRIDDKLSRLKSGDDSIESDEDVIEDLIGYLVLLLVVMREQ